MCLKIKNKRIGFKILLMALITFFNTGCFSTGEIVSTQIDNKKRMDPIFNNNQYSNWIPSPTFVGDYLEILRGLVKGGERTEPEGEIPVVYFSGKDLSGQANSRRKIRWLGHSGVLIEINKTRIMIDPMLSTYASPIPGFAKRYSNAPIQIEKLPHVDFVLISHDHYDHLDKATVKALADKGSTFFVPSGVDDHLKDWGIKEEQIQSLSWWQEERFKDFRLICVPARHYSKRSLFEENRTLWAGWIIKDQTTRIFFSGDSGYGNHFKIIGDKYGPFDLAIIEIGAYNQLWPYIHSNPENAVQAFLDVGGKLLLPVHWAAFALAKHPWDEPIIWTVNEAKAKNIKLITPKIGEQVDLDLPIVSNEWWTSVE